MQYILLSVFAESWWTKQRQWQFGDVNLRGVNWCLRVTVIAIVGTKYCNHIYFRWSRLIYFFNPSTIVFLCTGISLIKYIWHENKCQRIKYCKITFEHTKIKVTTVTKWRLWYPRDVKSNELANIKSGIGLIWISISGRSQVCRHQKDYESGSIRCDPIMLFLLSTYPIVH